MRLLANIITSIQGMLVLVPFILNLYTENGSSNDDLPVPPLFDMADELNGILAMLIPQSLPEGIPPPVVIAPEDAVEGYDNDREMGGRFDGWEYAKENMSGVKKAVVIQATTESSTPRKGGKKKRSRRNKK